MTGKHDVGCWRRQWQGACTCKGWIDRDDPHLLTRDEYERLMRTAPELAIEVVTDQSCARDRITPRVNSRHVLACDDTEPKT